MDVMMETCLIIALSFAVFSAVATIGASLALGIGYERLRAGFEVIRKQTGYFSDQIYRLDTRVEKLETQDRPAPAGIAVNAMGEAEQEGEKPSYLSIDSNAIAQERQAQNQDMSLDASAAPAQRMLLDGDFRPEGIRFH